MVLKNKTICITGATGYLASHLICRLLNNNILHVTTRNKSIFKEIYIPMLIPYIGNHICQLKIFECDYNNKTSILEALNGCDYLIHCASPVIIKGQKGVAWNTENIINPAINITENILNCVNETNISVVLYTSSTCSVYSKGKHIMNSDDWAEETDSDPYSTSKLISEQRAWDISKNAKWKLIVMLPGRIIGPTIYNSIPESYIYITEILNSTNLLNYHSSYCDVRDVAEIYEGFLEINPESGRYIIAFGTYTMVDYYNEIKKYRSLPEIKFTDPDTPFLFDMKKTLEVYPIKHILFQISVYDSVNAINKISRL